MLSDLLWELVALAILFGPADPPPETVWPPKLRSAIVHEAMGRGAWIPDWKASAYDACFTEAVNEVRFDLAAMKTAPPLEDCRRFPPSEITDASATFAARYADHLREQRLYRPHLSWWFDEVLAETEYCRLCHYNASWAAWPTASPCVRRKHLAELRKLLGEEAYYSGRLPPAAPVWRFQVMR